MRLNSCTRSRLNADGVHLGDALQSELISKIQGFTERACLGSLCIKIRALLHNLPILSLGCVYTGSTMPNSNLAYSHSATQGVED